MAAMINRIVSVLVLLFLGTAASAQRVVPGAPSSAPDTIKVGQVERTKAINGTIAVLDSFYVFPDVAKRIGDSLRVRNRRDAYSGYGTALAFANRLNDDVRDLSHDKHMIVSYSAGTFVPRPASAPAGPTPGMMQFLRTQMDAVNCGFVKVEQLEGNIGFVKISGFFDADVCAETASAAMNLVAGARALIVDLRDNKGGRSNMVSYLSSYLFASRTHLTDVWVRSTGKTDELWTNDSVPGRRFGGEKPVFVLTSAETFSAAEEFAYNLQSLKRATVVGETTAGGAHPVSVHTVEGRYMVTVPFARAINPVTKTNWEGRGVEPDVRVPASDALVAAQRLASGGGRR
jgi:hypothetical protein